MLVKSFRNQVFGPVTSPDDRSIKADYPYRGFSPYVVWQQEYPFPWSHLIGYPSTVKSSRTSHKTDDHHISIKSKHNYGNQKLYLLKTIFTTLYIPQKNYKTGLVIPLPGSRCCGMVPHIAPILSLCGSSVIYSFGNWNSQSDKINQVTIVMLQIYRKFVKV